MKLLRWAVAGAASASVYVVYKYSIGRKATGENVFDSPPEDAPRAAKAKPARSRAAKDTAPGAKPARKSAGAAKSPKGG